MQRITIGRYRPVPDDVPLPEGIFTANAECAGWLEGVRDDGSEWIMFVDTHGSPALFWPRRDKSGAVHGDPINLAVT